MTYLLSSWFVICLLRRGRPPCVARDPVGLVLGHPPENLTQRLTISRRSSWLAEWTSTQVCCMQVSLQTDPLALSQEPQNQDRALCRAQGSPGSLGEARDQSRSSRGELFSRPLGHLHHASASGHLHLLVPLPSPTLTSSAFVSVAPARRRSLTIPCGTVSAPCCSRQRPPCPVPSLFCFVALDAV